MLEFNKPLEEGEFMCKYFYRRMIKQNKNVLGANLGATGSGKSYRDLRLAELWYNNVLKKPFPPENICFGTLSGMKRLQSGELTKGEFIIYEEAGANLGSLDFQARSSKLFTYVLQTFRSMNIGIMFNLPYLSMLNKSARMLLHYSMESKGIDHSTKQNKCKIKIHNVSQATGKIYRPYPRIMVNGRQVKLSELSFSMPSPELVKAYEEKKAEYLKSMQSGFINELQKQEDKDNPVKPLTDIQKRVLSLAQEGKKQVEIAEKVFGSKKMQGNVSKALFEIKKKGYKWVENEGIEGGVC